MSRNGCDTYYCCLRIAEAVPGKKTAEAEANLRLPECELKVMMPKICSLRYCCLIVQGENQKAWWLWCPELKKYLHQHLEMVDRTMVNDMFLQLSLVTAWKRWEHVPGWLHEDHGRWCCLHLGQGWPNQGALIPAKVVLHDDGGHWWPANPCHTKDVPIVRITFRKFGSHPPVPTALDCDGRSSRTKLPEFRVQKLPLGCIDKDGKTWDIISKMA